MFSKLLRGDKRSVMAKKNVLASFFIKGADTLVYLLLVPLTLGYLNAYEYGIWLTLNSILVWINSFDIGLGNGLRNKLAEAIAEGDKEKGRCYVSTTFVMLLIITLTLSIVFSIVISVVDWYSLLNVKPEVVGNLREVVLVSFLFFCLSFLFKFIGNVYQALQLPAVNNLLTFVGHLGSLIVICILKETIPGSLFWVAIVYSASYPIIYLICYPVTFSLIYPYLAPSFKYFRKEVLWELLSLSVLFFILQIMGVVLFSLSNLMISNLFGPDQVTPYNIAYRYFSIVQIFFTLILAPIWSATTDAYTKNDMVWIKRSMVTIRKVIAVFAVVLILMVLCSNIAYHLWVGDQVRIPFEMSLYLGGYTFVLLWSLSYSSFLYGMGKLHLQTINTTCVAIMFIPVCYLFAHFYGVTGVVVGMIVVNLPGAFLNTIQLNKLINHSAKGIWLK